jgi:hypothetical protein
MARQKTKPQPPAAAARAPADDAGITKMEAVRRALAKLGRDAKPLQIKALIKSEFGLEMSADHISTYKGVLRKKAGDKRRPGPEPQAQAAPAAARATAPGGITLDDIRAVKELADRIGAEKVRQLVDVLCH